MPGATQLRGPQKVDIGAIGGAGIAEVHLSGSQRCAAGGYLRGERHRGPAATDAAGAPPALKANAVAVAGKSVTVPETLGK